MMEVARLLGLDTEDWVQIPPGIKKDMSFVQ